VILPNIFQTKEGEVCGACGRRGGEEECLQGFCGET
jgi:hypothetical protein